MVIDILVTDNLVIDILVTDNLVIDILVTDNLVIDILVTDNLVIDILITDNLVTKQDIIAILKETSTPTLIVLFSPIFPMLIKQITFNMSD